MRHTRRDALAVIEQLAILGQALGYETREEHRVGRSAAVDLSWTAAESNDVPLFVFEVESTVSTSLANNAQKVFGSPLQELAKPLFFFHIVLSGGPDNERIRNAHLVWGQHNYRVYRWSDRGQPEALVHDALRQHRRVSRHIEPLRLARALDEPWWGGPGTVDSSLRLTESLRFDGRYLGDYARLARELPQYARLFADRVRVLRELPPVGEFDDDYPFLSREGYGGAPGDYVPGLLETALLIRIGDVEDRDGPTLLEEWATSCGHGRRMIDASFGLARDYDAFVIGTAPIQYALAALVLRNRPSSWDWVMSDWAALLERERVVGLHPTLRLPAILWMAHTIAAAGRGQEGAASTERLDAAQLFSSLHTHVRDSGGIPRELVFRPPGPFDPTHDLPEWVSSADLVSLPPVADLQSGASKICGDGVGPALTSVGACLDALTSYEFYADPGRDLLRALYMSRDTTQ